jgi:antitoxin component YwqK of YwqJK toxin-antitoxin module
MIKSKLIFENGKLHGEVVKFVYENGKLQKKLLESYTNGKLQKSEEFKYNNDSLYRIEGSKYAIQYPFQNTYSYTIEPDRFDTIRTSMYRNIIYNDSSINDDFLTFPSFPHGIRQSIHNNKLITFGEYFLGKKVGVWYSDKACCTDTIAIYERTKSKSNVVAYHIGGKPMIEGSIINHKKEGTWKVYDEYGQLKKSISFENDILNGNSNFYDSNSITKRTYLDGKFISEEVTPK